MIRGGDANAWMWAEALAALERAERHHRGFFALLAGKAPQPAWEPPVDILETEHGLRIFVALPGIRLDRVTLLVEPPGLVVQTERPPPSSTDCQRIRRLEIPYGHFERRIELPAGRYTLREQHMADGCLELYLIRE